MVHFIICDDNKNTLKKVQDIINHVMMKNKLIYKILAFKDFDESFKNVMEEKLLNKIYILDIETPSASGIDIAREIRKKDLDSVIIFLTNHNELGNVLLQDEIMFLTFICKLNKQDSRLESAIQTVLKIVGVKQAIRFEEKGAIYTIALQDILYITHDNVERRSVIVTDRTEYRVHKTLQDLKKLLDERFFQTHRACIVNTSRIRVLSKKKDQIIFDNDMEIHLLSKDHRKELTKLLKEKKEKIEQ